jgi:hypothetical protein
MFEGGKEARNKPQSTLYCVIPACRGLAEARSGLVGWLDPGSSLLEMVVERWNRETRRFSDRLYCIGACIAPFGITTSPKTKHIRLYAVSSRPVGVPAEARSGLVGWLEPGSSALGWQSPFATETGGLFQTGNSVASAEQTSAAQYHANPRLLSA